MSFSQAGIPALSPNVDAPDPESGARMALISAFLTLQVLGLVGSCALVLTTTLAARAPRNATWQNFFTSWIVSTVSYSLLLFAGEVGRPDPEFGVCLAQAGLVYGIPSLTAATTFGLIAQIWFNVQALLGFKIAHERAMTLTLLILPYVLLFSMVIASWVIGIREPDLVGVIGSGMYCHIGPTGILGKVSAGLVAMLLFPTLTLEVMICVALRRNWAALRRMKNSLSIIIRVMIFTVLGILAIGVSGVFVFSGSHGAGLNIVFSAMPVVAVVVFATQLDILSVWMFWKKPAEKPLLAASSASSSSVSRSSSSSPV
ncbi:hypothetical protein B0H15DRAFT_158926 [Mycena belliarum]|uniref:Uncharacterized protein n=1 Tax=Mycena belliarum TaxID=1033014 RepID=A0AAD6U8K2_9AGAR|nr:hypothetical protein B0H15DRAFT_158926 [Mycena belliae]